MRLLGIFAAVAIGIAGGSIALAQHGGGMGSGMGMGSGGTMMACCDGATDGCTAEACPGHKKMKDGTCDMSACCGEMMGGGMGDMMKDRQAGGMGNMGDMMKDHHRGDASKGEMMCCGEKSKCCKSKKPKPSPSAVRAAVLPNLK